jgi:hypothetical protein
MQEDICLDRAPKLLIGTILFLAFGGILVLSIEILQVWWYLLVPGWTVLVAVSVLRSPACICFSSDRQVLEITYLLGGLLHKSESYPFSSIAAIQSFPRVSGESDPEVSLEIVMHDGSKRIIESAAPDWAKQGPLLGLGRCREPQGITLLRKRIVDMVGIEDRGFLGRGG